MSNRPVIHEIAAVLQWHGPWAYGDTPSDLDRVAHEWAAAGFAANAVDAWLQAHCADPATAQALRAAGITPTEAAQWTEAHVGLGGYRETVAYKVANGDLSVAEAVAYLYEQKGGQ
jgi:hypothetical protein